MACNDQFHTDQSHTLHAYVSGGNYLLLFRDLSIAKISCCCWFQEHRFLHCPDLLRIPSRRLRRWTRIGAGIMPCVRVRRRFDHASTSRRCHHLPQEHKLPLALAKNLSYQIGNGWKFWLGSLSWTSLEPRRFSWWFFLNNYERWDHVLLGCGSIDNDTIQVGAYFAIGQLDLDLFVSSPAICLAT